jgi:hypothetical protein
MKAELTKHRKDIKSLEQELAKVDTCNIRVTPL